MQKKLFFLFILFLSKYSFASQSNFEPKSNFWFYFIVITILTGAGLYFFLKSRFLSQDKQISIIFGIILFSFIISYFLDSDYKKTQIEKYKAEKIISESENKTRYIIEKRRRLQMQKKIEELEYENSKLKSIENNIKSKINTKENIEKSKEIRSKIAQLEDDLLLLDMKINQVNKGNYDDLGGVKIDNELDELDKEFSVIEKIKKRKKYSQNLEKKSDFSLKNKDINSVLDEELKTRKNSNKIKIVSSQNTKEPKQTNKTKQEIFLENHYKLLENKKIKQAYLETPKKVSFNDYNNWYKNVEKIIINKIEKKSKNIYNVDLDIIDKQNQTNYIVEKTLDLDPQTKNYKIIKSKTISVKKAKKQKVFDINSLAISSFLFKKLINNKNYQVLDIREDLENSAGKIKNSIHIRLEDLKLISYEKLNKEKTILIYDWDGKKAQKAALFLKNKGFKVKFLKDGLKKLKTSNIFFSGTKNFFEKYNKANYKKIFSTNELEKILKLKNIYLIDVRKIEDFKRKKIENSINIPLVYLPKTKWDFYLKKIPEKSSIITICDNPENCFYARIVGIEMQKRLYKYLGTYKLKD